MSTGQKDYKLADLILINPGNNFFLITVILKLEVPLSFTVDSPLLQRKSSQNSPLSMLVDVIKKKILITERYITPRRFRGDVGLQYSNIQISAVEIINPESYIIYLVRTAAIQL